MSAIANFKKRREAAKAENKSQTNEVTNTPENEALWLLGKLFNCSNELAIGAAEAFVGKGLHIVDDEVHMFAPNPHYADHASGKDETVIAVVTRDEQGHITSIERTTDELENSADSVNHAADSVNHAADSVTDAADKVEQSASAIDDSANDLAYSADSIANAANDIKEATSELKKPSAVPASSHSKKTAEPKNNSIK
jgi:methyl-accepting chemotaxis protein